MKQYDSYKDSGVQWIGKIPSHWERCRFKDFVSLRTDVSSSDVKIGLENIEGKTGRYIETNSEFEGDGVAFDVNDIVYGKLRPYLQKVWLATFTGNAVGDFFVFRSKKNCESKYLQYLMLSDGFTSECNGATLGAKMPRVSSDFILTLHYFLPPLSEQQAIATYLDKKCAEIDKAIATQQKRIELLQELRQNTITHTVTRGINPDVSLKDSGVEWIGMVPEHWEVKRLKHICDINGRVGYRGYTTADLVPEGEGAYTIGGKHITNNVLDLTDADYISWVKYYESPEIMVKKGDIVTAQRGSLGKTAIVREEIGEATINPSLVLLNNIKIFNEFLYWYMVSTPVLIAIELLNTSTAVPMVSQWQISNITIPVPPNSEQQAIVTHIESETAKLDKQVAKAKSQISLLQELKQSIITEVVTGKRKVC